MNPTWYRLDPAALLLELTETPDAQEWRRRSSEIAKALIHGEKGLDPWADRMLDESATFSEKRRRAGLASVEARRRRAAETRDETENETRNETERWGTSVEHISTSVEQRSSGVEHGLNKAQPDRRTYRQTDGRIPRSPLAPPPARTDGGGNDRHGAGNGRTDGSGAGKKQDGNGNGSGGGPHAATPAAGDWRADFEVAGFAQAFDEDWRLAVASMDAARLPSLAAWYCGETGNAHAKKRYAAAIRRKGAQGFRDLLDTFVGDVEAGEEPQNRGRAFMAKVKQWEDAQ